MTDESARLEREAIESLDAIDYARLGWYTRPTAGKMLLWDDDGLAFDPTKDEQEIRRQWAMYPDEIGCSLELKDSGLFAIDVDTHDGINGHKTAAEVLDGELPAHPVCSTLSGGLHLLFRQAVCSTILPGRLGPGLEVLTARCVIPPTPSYSWIVPPQAAPPPLAPLWLWRLLPRVEERRRPHRAGGRQIRFAIDDVLPRLTRVRPRRTKGGGWTACCPAHDDRTPSFWIREGDDGKPYVGCSVCTGGELLAAIERLVGVRGAA